MPPKGTYRVGTYTPTKYKGGKYTTVKTDTKPSPTTRDALKNAGMGWNPNISGGVWVGSASPSTVKGIMDGRGYQKS